MRRRVLFGVAFLGKNGNEKRLSAKDPSRAANQPRDYETCHKCSLHLFEVMFRMAADPCAA